MAGLAERLGLPVLIVARARLGMLNHTLLTLEAAAARGLRTLAEALKPIADVVVVAPDRNRSGASNSLTLETPLRVERVDPDLYYVNGTPTDCVHIAITGLLEQEPDVLISGINNGANLGDDVLYSGTVAAAMEGRFLGIPSIAVSLVLNGFEHYETAAQLVRKLVERNVTDPLPTDSPLAGRTPPVRCRATAPITPPCTTTSTR